MLENEVVFETAASTTTETNVRVVKGSIKKSEINARPQRSWNGTPIVRQIWKTETDSDGNVVEFLRQDESVGGVVITSESNPDLKTRLYVTFLEGLPVAQRSKFFQGVDDNAEEILYFEKLSFGIKDNAIIM